MYQTIWNLFENLFDRNCRYGYIRIPITGKNVSIFCIAARFINICRNI